MNWLRPLPALLALAALAGVGAVQLAFPVAQAGFAPYSDLARYMVLPGALLIALVYGLANFWQEKSLSRAIALGALGGLVATVSLEIVRETGFRVFNSMPGDLPMLMGVLLTDRALVGPSATSNLVGWGVHFLNGATLGVFAALILAPGGVLDGMIFATLVALGFLVSPVVQSLGVGYFGVRFGPGFATTVFLAHWAFGATLGYFLSRRDIQGFLSQIRQIRTFSRGG